MADDLAPHRQPLAALPLIASLIDGELADGQEHHATLLSVRDRPHVLDDATIERSIKLHTEQREFLGVFAEQLARWRHERPTDEQRRELDRLEGQIERSRIVLGDILELAEELQQGTIERVLAKSDLELGIEALLRMTNGRLCAPAKPALSVPCTSNPNGYQPSRGTDGSAIAGCL